MNPNTTIFNPLVSDLQKYKISNGIILHLDGNNSMETTFRMENDNYHLSTQDLSDKLKIREGVWVMTPLDLANFISEIRHHVNSITVAKELIESQGTINDQMEYLIYLNDSIDKLSNLLNQKTKDISDTTALKFKDILREFYPNLCQTMIIDESCDLEISNGLSLIDKIKTTLKEKEKLIFKIDKQLTIIADGEEHVFSI